MKTNFDKPEMNRDLTIHIVDSGIFLRDKKTYKTYQLGNKEFEILSSFNGKRTLDELKILNSSYMNAKQLEEFVFYTYANGLLENSEKQKNKFNIFKIRRSLCCPSDYFHKCSVIEVLRNIMIIGSLISLVFLSFFVFSRLAPIFNALFSNNYLQTINIFYYFISVFVIGFVHEIGHALAIISYGGNVFEIGVMLNYFHPAFYVDITGVDKIKNKTHRIIIWLAGIMNEIILAAPTMFLTFYENSPLYMNRFLLIFNIINVSMILFNLLFVIKLDGYYILSELLSMSALREKSISMLFNVKNVQMVPIDKIEDRIIYLIVGLISTLYLPFFLLQLIFSGIERFAPRSMQMVSKLILIWLIIAMLIGVIRLLFHYRMEKKR